MKLQTVSRIIDAFGTASFLLGVSFFAVITSHDHSGLCLAAWILLSAAVFSLASFLFLVALYSSMHKQEALSEASNLPIGEWPIMSLDYFSEAAQHLIDLGITIYKEDAMRHYRQSSIEDAIRWSDLLDNLPKKPQWVIQIEKEKELSTLMS